MRAAGGNAGLGEDQQGPRSWVQTQERLGPETPESCPGKRLGDLTAKGRGQGHGLRGRIGQF